MSAEATERRTDEIPAWKHDEVHSLVETISQYESVGVVNITGIPSRQLQNMRSDLHGIAQLRVSRNTLLLRALDEIDDGVEPLKEYVSGQVGLIGTNENPFGLYKQLEASKTPAPINAGEVVPNDITIPKGDTGIDPGPFVGELQQVGAAARITDGSIHVTEDSIVATAGDTVTDQLAAVLSELEIEPKEVGLDLRAVYSDAIIFEPDELRIDIDEYRRDVQIAAAFAHNLSVNAVYPTSKSVPTLLTKARAEARNLGLYAAIEDESLVPELVRKADSQLRALVARIDDSEALPAELRDLNADVVTEEPEPEEQIDETTETDADDDHDDDDDDEEDGAAGLGAMFG